jgi:hypothetical protein
MRTTSKESLAAMNHAQLAWEFLRRNAEYISSYKNFTSRCLGARELTRKEEVSILDALDALGAWRPRYEPWIKAALHAGKTFIKYVDIDEDYFQGWYFESETNLDPMRFMLREWIDPESSPLPLDRTIFDQAGALDLKILRKGTPEFAGAFRLGLVDCADDGSLFDQTADSDGMGETMLLAMLPPNLVGDRSVVTLHGFPPRQLLWETCADKLDQVPRETVVKMLRAQRNLVSEARTPTVDTHKVLRLHRDDGVHSFDLHVNLQFDLTLPLRDQIEAAHSHLNEQQARLRKVTDKAFAPAHGDIHVPNQNGVYKTYLDLLDAYDDASDEHGRLLTAIQVVCREPDLDTTSPRYTTLAKAFARATAICQAEYRSLAFV